MDRPSDNRPIGSGSGYYVDTVTMPTVLAYLVLIGVLFGCMASSPATKPAKPKPSPKRPAGTTLSAIAFESFQARDRLRAEKLRTIADDVRTGRLKYDGPVMEEISKAGAEASEETWKPVAQALQTLLGDGEKLDAVKCEKAILDLAVAAEKAGM